jgi:hypothetical protein
VEVSTAEVDPAQIALETKRDAQALALLDTASPFNLSEPLVERELRYAHGACDQHPDELSGSRGPSRHPTNAMEAGASAIATAVAATAATRAASGMSRFNMAWLGYRTLAGSRFGGEASVIGLRGETQRRRRTPFTRA